MQRNELTNSHCVQRPLLYVRMEQSDSSFLGANKDTVPIQVHLKKLENHEKVQYFSLLLSESESIVKY